MLVFDPVKRIAFVTYNVFRKFTFIEYSECIYQYSYMAISIHKFGTKYKSLVQKYINDAITYKIFIASINLLRLFTNTIIHFLHNKQINNNGMYLLAQYIPQSCSLKKRPPTNKDVQ